MNTKHTAGPWNYSGGPTITDSQGFHVTFVNEYASSFGDGKHQANARLIAAAPELLDALQFAMLERACNAGDAILSGDEWREFAIKARAAIAKATGDAP